ncbi:hypothetical protein [Hydrogenimonas thermophila]|uniref:Phage-associated protein, BcepMu gp16 family n=1 Tax=Hydrogenimonas thermophila TaxID=223786 RepID=A0A1I5RUD0_9BACT|nr:hypothetical protein [Hydrogenimonas thermophila]SFP61566.1 hypothetical protein SAMN05216234_12843 [Hydrogenimonas thermophila]
MKQKLNIDTAKILDDWGTVKRFCKKNGININTYRVVKAGNGKSKKIENILKEHGYLK